MYFKTSFWSSKQQVRSVKFQILLTLAKKDRHSIYTNTLVHFVFVFVCMYVFFLFAELRLSPTPYTLVNPNTVDGSRITFEIDRNTDYNNFWHIGVFSTMIIKTPWVESSQIYIFLLLLVNPVKNDVH